MEKMNLADYPLEADLAIRDWLACGTITSPIENLEEIVPVDGAAFGQDKRWVLNYWAWSKASKRIKKRVYQQLPPFSEKLSNEYPILGTKGFGGKEWRYARTGEDQVIDFSLFN